MKQVIVALVLAGALVSCVMAVRSCSQRTGGAQGLPRGVEYVMKCRADGHEFSMTPGEMNAAFDAGDVRGDGAGNDLFRCPQCGKLEAMQQIQGMEQP